MNDPENKLTIRQKILVAAASISNGDEAITLERIIVRSWELYPGTFSLRGYPYPDSNKVQAKICGYDGMLHLGWLAAVEVEDGPRLYRVTRKGRYVANFWRKQEAQRAKPAKPEAPAKPEKPAAAPRAKAPEPPAPPLKHGPLRLDDRELEEIHRLVKRARSVGFARAITFAEAKDFWGIAPGDNGDSACVRIYNTSAVIAKTISHFDDRNDEAPHPRLPPMSQCFVAKNVDRLLFEKFAAELARLGVNATTTKEGT